MWIQNYNISLIKPMNTVNLEHLPPKSMFNDNQAPHDTDLPRNVGLPASPGLTQVLQDGSGLVLFDTLRHHVQYVVHHSSTQLQVKVRFHTLFSNRLGYTLGVTSYKSTKLRGDG